MSTIVTPSSYIHVELSSASVRARDAFRDAMHIGVPCVVKREVVAQRTAFRAQLQGGTFRPCVPQANFELSHTTLRGESTLDDQRQDILTHSRQISHSTWTISLTEHRVR